MKNIKEEITWDRLSEIATQALHKLLEDDYDNAMEFFDEADLSEEERKYFEVPMEKDDEYEEDYNDDECPRDFCMYCEHQSHCFPNGIGEDDFFYHEGYLVNDPMDV